MKVLTRFLLLIAAGSLAVSLICFAALGWVGGPGWRMGHDMVWTGPGWMGEMRRFSWGMGGPGAGNSSADGPPITRVLPWSGGETLRFETPAQIDYTQGPAARITVSGPAELVNRLAVSDGRIALNGATDGPWGAGPLKIVVTAPAVTRFGLDADQSLAIHGYRQDQMDLDITGAGDVTAEGQARQVKLTISGSGQADLGGLHVSDMGVEIDGSGQATIAPRNAADVHVAGSGSVLLLTHPAHLNTDITGSGAITQPSSEDGQAT